jgi:hypothetical protein
MFYQAREVHTEVYIPRTFPPGSYFTAAISFNARAEIKSTS